MQNDDFVDLYAPHNRIIGSKDHAAIQTNLAKADKVTARFNGQFKTYSICRAIHRM
ncbi:40S ribosomal protein S21, partial [Eschrichtius robustus]|nr:40S ribosomal protein S21 [Eschrichtius robustus]